MSERLREGWTTGTCAAAAAKAAVSVLCGVKAGPTTVKVELPDGQRVELPVAVVHQTADQVTAAVVKDAGDDPDVTHGARVFVSAQLRSDDAIVFTAGEGVGTVTRPGLSLAVGEPAINPVPRRMIAQALREVTRCGVTLEIGIEGGRELAAKTFNPRLGIEGGLSILGTSGRVRPFSHAAIEATVACALDVTAAAGRRCPVLVPGRLGEKAARHHFELASVQIVEVSNEWGFALQRLARYAFEAVLLVGHPGKLAKLAAGHWQTHSSRAPGAVGYVCRLATDLLGRELSPANYATTEAVLRALNKAERVRLCDVLAERIRSAVQHRLGALPVAAVLLVDLQGQWLGSAGGLTPWRR